MDLMTRRRLVDQLKVHEGLRLKAYRCPAGATTVGYGRNLDDHGISHAEAEMLLQNDIERCELELKRHVLFYEGLSPVRKRVLMDMCFNLGISGLLKFKNTLKAMSEGNYAEAAEMMLKSKWAKQVKGRALKLSNMMHTGVDDEDR